LINSKRKSKVRISIGAGEGGSFITGRRGTQEKALL